MNQIRVKIEDEAYKVLRRDGKDVVLENDEGGEELWTERDDFAGFVFEIDGIGYEFVTSL